MEKPDRHFEMAEPTGLPAAGVKSALHSGADFHVFEMKRGELLRRLSVKLFEVGKSHCFGRNKRRGHQLQAVGSQRLETIPDNAVGRGREQDRGVNEKQATFGFLRMA